MRRFRPTSAGPCRLVCTWFNMLNVSRYCSSLKLALCAHTLKAAQTKPSKEMGLFVGEKSITQVCMQHIPPLLTVRIRLQQKVLLSGFHRVKSKHSLQPLSPICYCCAPVQSRSERVSLCFSYRKPETQAKWRGGRAASLGSNCTGIEAGGIGVGGAFGDSLRCSAHSMAYKFWCVTPRGRGA